MGKEPRKKGALCMTRSSPGKITGVECEKAAFRAIARRTTGISLSCWKYSRVYQYGNSLLADESVCMKTSRSFSTRGCGAFLTSRSTRFFGACPPASFSIETPASASTSFSFFGIETLLISSLIPGGMSGPTGSSFVSATSIARPLPDSWHPWPSLRTHSTAGT